MSLRPGEVVLIRIDFHQKPGDKLRPALVLPVAELLTSMSLFISQGREAGLNTASTIRVHKLTVLAKNEVMRRIGELTAPDRTALTAVLRRAFSLDQ